MIQHAVCPCDTCNCTVSCHLQPPCGFPETIIGSRSALLWSVEAGAGVVPQIHKEPLSRGGEVGEEGPRTLPSYA